MRKILFVIIATLLILISHQAAHAADDPAWLKIALKKEYPNELAYQVGIDPECPFTDEEATLIVKGVFVRSRIKPLWLHDWVVEPLYLSVNSSCLKTEGSRWAYSIAIRFGNFSDDVPILYDNPFGAFGIGGTESIKDSLKEGVERAITAYLKVNFDLGD